MNHGKVGEMLSLSKRVGKLDPDLTGPEARQTVVFYQEARASFTTVWSLDIWQGIKVFKLDFGRLPSICILKYDST